MRKSKLIFMFCVSTLLLASCQFTDDDYHRQSKARTLEMDVEAIKDYMTIDSAAHQYSVVITEDQREAIGISKGNLRLILSDIVTLNNRIDNDIKAGNIVTMYLAKENSFQSVTIDPSHKLQNISFQDVRVKKAQPTRAGSVLASEYFMDGNWESGTNYTPEFVASDHVTSILSVGYSRGFWQVTFKCNTGTSSYGTSFSAYSTGSSHGEIKRYWWWNNGGGAPFKWKLILGGAPGGEASGNLCFMNT